MLFPVQSSNSGPLRIPQNTPAFHTGSWKPETIGPGPCPGILRVHIFSEIISSTALAIFNDLDDHFETKMVNDLGRQWHNILGSTNIGDMEDLDPLFSTLIWIKRVHIPAYYCGRLPKG